MPDNRKNDDIEELSLDGEVELKINDIKIEPSDIKIENLDFDTSDGQVSESSNDSASSDNSTDANNMDGNTSNSNVSGDSSSTEKNDDTASEELSADSGNDTSGVSDGSSESGADDVNNGENASGETGETGASSDNNDSEKKDDKNGQENPDDKPKDEDKDKKDNKPEDDKKGDESKNPDDKNKNNQEKDKSPEDKNKNDQENGAKKEDKDKDKDKPSSDTKPGDKPDTSKQPDNKPNNSAANKPGQRKNGLKDKWDNRPKTPKDFANRAKNHAKNAARNKARDAMDNSSIGQGINNAKDKIDKGKKAVDDVKKTAKIVKVVLTSKVFLIVLACILVVVIISVLPSMLASGSPGVGGEVEEEENYSKYSEDDQKTIDSLKEKTQKHPTGDPTYAMAATLYPYIEEMQNGNVGSLRGKTNVEQEDDPDIYGEEEQAEDNADENTEDDSESSDDSSEENGSGTTANDPYLELFREKNILGQEIYLKKFETLLKESEAGEEAFTEFLKNEWFKKDKGYKELFDGVDNSEELTDAIIDDLLSQKEDFLGYFFENCNTANASTIPLNAAGNAGTIKGTIYVTLRDYYSTNSDGSFEKKNTAKGKFLTEDYYNSPILYDTKAEPLTFARYIMGVVYAESESCLNSESCAKSLMITAKSFAIGRQSMYIPEYIESENKTIIHMRGNVGDQDFCDVYEGCKTGKFSKDTWSIWEGEGHNNRKGPLSSEKLANLEQWWNDIADQYVMHKESSKFAGNQYNDYNSSCQKGKCVSQTRMLKASEHETDYMNLLFNSNNGGFDNTSYTLYNSSTDELYAVTTGDKVCNNGDITGSRQAIINFAVSMVGKIPYYFYEGQSDNYGALGHALNKNFDDNHFGETSSLTDHKGRNKYGLDCSGFVDFVFWNALDNNLGNGNTDTLRSSAIKIEFSELKPGDLGFLNDNSSGTQQHVGIYIGNDEWIELNPSGVTKGPYPNFKVYYRPNILVELDTQENSDNQGDGVATGDMSSPIKGKSLSCSDYPNYSSGSYHGGTDLSVAVGTEVLAVDGGKVITSKDLKGCDGRKCVGGYYSYGRYIVIQHNNGVTSLYAHLSERRVKEGDNVSKGQIIGLSGENGNTYGAHLHIEIKRNGNNQNPCNYIK